MAIERVKRVELLGLEEIKEEFIKELQKQELLHLDFISFPKNLPELSTVETAINILSEFEDKNFLGDMFKEPVFLKKEEIENIDQTKLLEVCKEIIHLKNKLSQLKEKKKQLLKEIEELNFWKFLNFSLKDLQNLNIFSFVFIKVSEKDLDKLKKELKIEAAIKEIYRVDKFKILVVITFKDKESNLRNFLKSKNIFILDLPLGIMRKNPELSLSELKNQIERELSVLNSEYENVLKEISKKQSFKKELMILYEFLYNSNLCKDTLKNLPKTKRFFGVTGWILEKDEKKFFNFLKRFEGKVYVKTREPLKTESPPTKLKNPQIISPFEILTTMYAPPSYYSLDPTMFLAPFFFFFVGVCISDAGYGLVLSVLSFYILKKKKLSSKAKLFFKLLGYLGISTFFVGVFLGSFFGIELPFKLIDMKTSPFEFLIFCFLVGLVQILLGLFLKAYLSLKRRNYNQFLLQVSWIGILVCLPLYFLVKSLLLKYLSILFCIGIILFSSESKNIIIRFFKGLYELYGISRYLSDVLSYSRLLALGMATGVIAMVINILAEFFFKIPVLGLILGGIFLVFGHSFNIFINLLSGFIHSARLQFVEFFPKFFELGKKYFEPFRIVTKYTRLIN